MPPLTAYVKVVAVTAVTLALVTLMALEVGTKVVTMSLTTRPWLPLVVTVTRTVDDMPLDPMPLERAKFPESHLR